MKWKVVFSTYSISIYVFKSCYSSTSNLYLSPVYKLENTAGNNSYQAGIESRCFFCLFVLFTPNDSSFYMPALRLHIKVLTNPWQVKDFNCSEIAALNTCYNNPKQEGSNLTQTLYLLSPLLSDFISLTVFHQIPELCICIPLCNGRWWRGTHSLDTFPPVTQELHQCLIPLWLSATLLSIVQCFI